MVIATMLGGLASLLWLGLIGYILFVVVERARGRDAKISITLVSVVLLAALVTSTAGAGVVVVEPGEVGVVVSAFTGTKPNPLYPGINFVVPYIETVVRYSTREQVYTMSKIHAEGEIQGDDSLWSPTSEGLQVGIDSSTRFAVDPKLAPQVHNAFGGQRQYIEVLVRPTIRSIVRLHVSQYTVTEVYGPMRGQIQGLIEKDIRQRFGREGLLLLSFDIRNINFTEDYATSIEQKQIAQQQAEQMQFVLQREKQEAERKRVEAEGYKDAAITRAQGEAESLRLINEQLTKNADLLTYRYIEKLAPNVQVMMLPSGSPFIIDVKQMMEQGTGQ